MNTVLLFKIIELALGIVKSRTSTDVDDKIDEALALAQIYQYGKQAFDLQVGQPVDEGLITPKEPLP